MADQTDQTSASGSVDLPAARIQVFADTSAWDAAREKIGEEIKRLGEDAKKALDLSVEFDALEKRADTLAERLRAALDLTDELDQLAKGLETIAEAAARIKVETGKQGKDDDDDDPLRDRPASPDQTLGEIKALVSNINDMVSLLAGNDQVGLK